MATKLTTLGARQPDTQARMRRLCVARGAFGSFSLSGADVVASLGIKGNRLVGIELISLMVAEGVIEVVEPPAGCRAGKYRHRAAVCVGGVPNAR